MRWEKSLIPVGLGYEDDDEFFMRGWVWDSETCPAPPRCHSYIILKGKYFII